MVQNLIRNVLGFLILSVLLSACLKTSPDVIEVNTRPVDKPSLVLPEADSIKAYPVKWTIVTPDNQEKIFQDLESSTGNAVVFALTADGYERLSKNINELRRYIEQQKSILVAYKNYYVAADKIMSNSVIIE